MKSKRPLIITIICVIGFIGLLVAVPTAFSNIAKSIGSWYPPYLILSSIVGLVCLVGLWQMKKWGVIGYTAFAAINQIVFLVMGVWNVFALIIPSIIVAIIFAQYKKMS